MARPARVLLRLPAHWRSWLLLGLAFASLSCERGARTPTPLPIPTDDTTLGPGDVFIVRVYGEDDLSASYRIAPDGTVDFPLVGRLAVKGKEPTEVADLIAHELHRGQILVAPQVSVVVEEYNSKRFSVMGAVAQPGTFPMSNGLTVVQAISLAGGFTPLASRNSVVVTRRRNGELRRYEVAVDRMTRGEVDDFPVTAGDIVYVPERLF